jgi:hypothetical protein
MASPLVSGVAYRRPAPPTAYATSPRSFLSLPSGAQVIDLTSAGPKQPTAMHYGVPPAISSKFFGVDALRRQHLMQCAGKSHEGGGTSQSRGHQLASGRGQEARPSYTEKGPERTAKVPSSGLRPTSVMQTVTVTDTEVHDPGTIGGAPGAGAGARRKVSPVVDQVHPRW